MVTHNCGTSILATVKRILPEIDLCIIVDNASGSTTKTALRQIRQEHGKSVLILENEENQFFAKAANRGLREAIDRGADFILQLNDDNSLSSGAVGLMLNTFTDAAHEQIGLVAAQVNMIADEGRIGAIEVREESLVASAGTLIASKVFADVGLYDEELVIGYEDFDLSLRIRAAGFQCLVTNAAVLYPNLGTMETRRLFRIRNIFVFHYSPLRRYLAARNGLLVLKRHQNRKLLSWVVWWEFNSLIGIFFFESQKRLKFRATLRGYRDGLLSRPANFSFLLPSC